MKYFTWQSQRLSLDLWRVSRVTRLSTLSATMQSANANYYLFICTPFLSRCNIPPRIVASHVQIVHRTDGVSRIASIIYAFSRIPSTQMQFSTRMRHIAITSSGIVAPLVVAILIPINDSVTRFSTFGSIDDIHWFRFLFFAQQIQWHSRRMSEVHLKFHSLLRHWPLVKSAESSARVAIEKSN